MTPTHPSLSQAELPERLPLIHPGEILQLDFLEPMQITTERLSQDIGVTQSWLNEILAGERNMTADTALRLSRYFGNSAEFWLNLQIQYDLRKAQLENAHVYQQISLVVNP
jgi:antitoxin HigA-1